MNGVSIFRYHDVQVRTQRDESNEPLFCAKDVCDILGYSNARDAMARHVDAEDVVKCDTLTNGGNQSLSYVTESGLYALIFGSNLPAAKDFKRWVTNEVLPSIRKTGSYSIQCNKLSVSEKMEAAKILLGPAGIEGNQLTLALDKVYKANTGESLLAQTGVELIAPTQERLLNPTELGKSLGLGPRAVNSRLQAKGFQIKGVAGWELTASGKALGGIYLDTGKKHSSGVPVRQIKWPATVATEL